MDEERTTVLATGQGRLRGVVSDGAVAFLGVPFAEPPVGEGRFARSVPHPGWEGLRDATRFGAASPQDLDLMADVLPGTEEVFYPTGSGFSEDCLTLNVWTPGVEGRAAPVLVWIHGGGWATGSGSGSWSDGAALARHRGIVVVGVNYRLGALGCLALGYSGDPEAAGLNNLGIHDQVTALEWVRDNIAAFGGDPGNVTLAGESAGAFSVMVHLAAPRSRGLFHRAIVQSGHTALLADESRAAADTVEFLGILGVPTGPGALAALRAMDLRHILDARRRMSARLLPPVVDGETLPEHPLTAIREGRAADVPLIIGMNADEAKSFRTLPLRETFDPVDLHEALAGCVDADTSAAVLALYGDPVSELEQTEVWDAIANDRDWRRHVYDVADARATADSPTFVYEFLWRTPSLGGSNGWHMAEIPFVFENLDAHGVAADLGHGVGGDPHARALSRRISSAWTSFARTGRPETPGAPQWRPYRPWDRATCFFDSILTVQLDYRRRQIEFWRDR